MRSWKDDFAVWLFESTDFDGRVLQAAGVCRLPSHGFLQDAPDPDDSAPLELQSLTVPLEICWVGTVCGTAGTVIQRRWRVWGIAALRLIGGRWLRRNPPFRGILCMSVLATSCG